MSFFFAVKTCDQDNNGKYYCDLSYNNYCCDNYHGIGNSYVLHMIGTFFLGICLSLGLVVCKFRHFLRRRMTAIWNLFYHKDEGIPPY